MHIWKHFRVITHHRHLVLQGCFRVGLIKQGLCHDLSKYSPTEFLVGAEYFQNIKSPNVAERAEKGYSTAWMHHKGRNRHHFEYWCDINPDTRYYEYIPMPRKYLVEMVMDRRAACMTYEKDAYTDASPLNYLERSMEKNFMNKQTLNELTFLLTMLKEKGEKETFSYIKNSVLKGLPFPFEEKIKQ